MKLNLKNKWIPLLIILLIAAGTGMGIFYYYSKISREINAISSTQISQSNRTLDTSGWETYVNRKYTYSVKYPKNWKAENYPKIGRGAVEDLNQAPAVAFHPMEDSFPFFMTLNIQVIEDKSWEQVLKDHDILIRNSGYITIDNREVESVSVGGVEGVKTIEKRAWLGEDEKGRTSEEFTVILIEKNQKVYLLDSMKDHLTIFNNMLSTFKFIE